MGRLNCPVCDHAVVVGLPLDAEIAAVANTGRVNTAEDHLTKTRLVSCPSNHDVYVTFSIDRAEQID